MHLSYDPSCMQVFDKGPLPSPDHRMGKQRTIIISLNARGKYALQQVEVQILVALQQGIMLV